LENPKGRGYPKPFLRPQMEEGRINNQKEVKPILRGRMVEKTYH